MYVAFVGGMRRQVLALTLALQTTILASGCGDDDDDDLSDSATTADGPMSDAAGGSDGANPDAAEGDAAPESPFDMPTDFDPLGCQPGSLAFLVADGVWHLDMRGGFFD